MWPQDCEAMLRTLLIWLVAAVLAIGSAATALGAITKNKAPELALSLFPQNGFASESLVARLTRSFLVESRGGFPDRVDPSWTALAVQAFEAEAVVADAIAVIALSRTGDARRDTMRKAFELSRRQQLVTGWMIIDSGRRNDIPAILDYYDTALRTSSTAAGVIIPVMANALTNEDFVEPFTLLLLRDPIWAPLFWRQVVQTPNSLINASKLRKAVEKNNGTKGLFQDSALISNLVREGQFEEAQSLYKTLTSKKQTDTGVVRNSNFRLGSEFPPFDWQLFSTGEYGAAISQGNMNLSAIGNAGGMMARQLARLPKGVLALEVEAVGVVPTGADLYVEFLCAVRSKSKSRAIKIPLSGKLTRQKIDNTEGACPYYWINIFGRSSDDINGFDVGITRFEVDVYR